MTFGFPKNLLLSIAGAALLLNSCVATSGPVKITKVNPYHLESTLIVDTDDQMVEFEHRRHLYGAVTSEEYRAKMGQYYSVFWKSTTKQSVTVRLDYRQGGTGSQVLSKELFIAKPKRSNVTKFEVTGDEYRDGGKVTQWKASVIENGSVVAEYKSYLWRE